jgi:hypothetical protein
MDVRDGNVMQACSTAASRRLPNASKGCLMPLRLTTTHISHRQPRNLKRNIEVPALLWPRVSLADRLPTWQLRGMPPPLRLTASLQTLSQSSLFFSWCIVILFVPDWCRIAVHALYECSVFAIPIPYLYMLSLLKSKQILDKYWLFEPCWVSNYNHLRAQSINQ